MHGEIECRAKVCKNPMTPDAPVPPQPNQQQLIVHPQQQPPPNPQAEQPRERGRQPAAVEQQDMMRLLQ